MACAAGASSADLSDTCASAPDLGCGIPKSGVPHAIDAMRPNELAALTRPTRSLCDDEISSCRSCPDGPAGCSPRAIFPRPRQRHGSPARPARDGADDARWALSAPSRRRACEQGGVRTTSTAGYGVLHGGASPYAPSPIKTCRSGAGSPRRQTLAELPCGPERHCLPGRVVWSQIASPGLGNSHSAQAKSLHLLRKTHPRMHSRLCATPPPVTMCPNVR